MTLLIPDGFAQITIPMKHDRLNREAVTTFGVDSSAWGPALSVGLDGVLADFQSSFATTIDNEVLVGPARAAVGTLTDEHIAAEGTNSFRGTFSGETPPVNCSVLVKKASNRGGRRGRGRMFLPWFIGEGDVEDTGALDPIAQGNLQVVADAFLAALPVGTFSTPMYLLHSESHPDTTNPTPPGSPNEVTGLFVDGIIGSQRRRLGR